MKPWILGLGLLVVGCGGSDDSPPTFCEEVQTKSDSCGMTFTVNCSSSNAAPEVMKTATKACLVNQDCAVWTSYMTNTF